MKKRYIVFSIIGVMLTIMFFTYKPIITYDSSHYLWLANLLSPNDAFSSWDVARGIVFPLLIYLVNLFFGPNNNALLLGMYLAYIVMLFACYKIYKDVISEGIISNIFKVIMLFLAFALIVINPIIFGYYHTLLTEFIAITMAVVMCYLSWKWLDINWKDDKRKYILYTLIFVVSTVFMWHLKQPYVGTVVFPLIIACIISIVKKFSLINIIQRLITILSCIFILIFSMILWNMILNVGKVSINHDRTSNAFFSKQIIDGLSNYKILEDDSYYTRESIENNKYIDDTDKQDVINILNGKSKYKNFKIVNYIGEQSKYSILFIKGDVLSTSDAVKFLLKMLLSNFGSVLDGYMKNYLAITNFYRITFSPNLNIDTTKFLKLSESNENFAISLKPYRYGENNVFHTSDEYRQYVVNYEEMNTSIVSINYVMNKLAPIVTAITKIVLLVLPILLILSIISYCIFIIKKQNKILMLNELIIILYGFSILHILIHIILGASIDRYTTPAMLPAYIAIFINVYMIIHRKKLQ